jgi:hypothetical protein
MEDLIFLLTASLALYKSPKKSDTVLIADSGCSVQLTSGRISFETTETEEGDRLHYAEHWDRNVTYGILCATLSEDIGVDEAQDVMINYINRLRGPFYAVHNIGPDLSGQKDAPEVISLVDYWQDGDGLDWKVKGYTNGSIIAVLYVRNINEVPVEKQDQFLDSFSFGSY